MLTQTKQVPLPCVRAKHGDSQPWVHNVEVLESIPADNPKPRYLGAFRDKHWDYQLELYRDSKGVFGELLSPVLDADSPDSRLYDAFFDPKLGALRFEAHFPHGDLQFSGTLRMRTVSGIVTRDGRRERVVLRRVKLPSEDSSTSRDQFDCAMILFNRY